MGKEPLSYRNMIGDVIIRLLEVFGYFFLFTELRGSTIGSE